jgi:hypothetical protein
MIALAVVAWFAIVAWACWRIFGARARAELRHPFQL